MRSFNTVVIIDNNNQNTDELRRMVTTTYSRAKCLSYSNSIMALRIVLEERKKPLLIFVNSSMPLIGCQDWIRFVSEARELSAIPAIIYPSRGLEEIYLPCRLLHNLLVQEFPMSKLQTKLSEILQSSIQQSKLLRHKPAL